MQQMARNLTDTVNGFLRNASYLIHDRDPLFTEAFEAILRERGVKCVRIPAQSLKNRFEKTMDTTRHYVHLVGEQVHAAVASLAEPPRRLASR
jgi:hypothetical protein